MNNFFCRYKLSNNSPIEYDPRLYDEVVDDLDEAEEDWAPLLPCSPCSPSWTGRDDWLVAEENLLARDVRLLVRAEEELAQCSGFSRLIPEPEGVKYLRYLERVGRADRLLAAWEAR